MRLARRVKEEAGRKKRIRDRVDWFNHRRLLDPIGNVPPAEAEARYYANLEAKGKAA